MVAKVNMPPSSGLMPQPWPATSPPQTKLTSRRLAGAVRKRPTRGSLENFWMGEIAEFYAIEDVLARGQILQQHFGGEVAFGQRRDRRQGAGLAKDSVVDTSTSICEGRSARAHTTPLSVLTSPDCTPQVIIGRSAARLR